MRRRSQKPSELTGFPILAKHVPMAALVQMLVVAEYLSFHRAAQALGTSQSSVSARIKTLEGTLGVVLFDRNTRGVRLTETGRRFVEQVDDALGILDHAIKTVSMRSRGEEGELRIGVHALVAGGFLDRLLEQFHSQYPLVRLHIAEGTARDAQMMVREGKLDVAFMAYAHEIPDLLHSRVIWRDRLMAVVPATHRLATQQNVEWRQLAEETFLVRHGGTGPQVHDLIVMRCSGRWPLPTIVRFDVGRSALLSMIAGGHGISLFVEEGVAALTANIAFLPIRDDPEPIAFSAVWLPQNRSASLRNLLSLASELGQSD